VYREERESYARSLVILAASTSTSRVVERRIGGGSGGAEWRAKEGLGGP
jgi:hypothetical protein